MNFENADTDTQLNCLNSLHVMWKILFISSLLLVNDMSAYFELLIELSDYFRLKKVDQMEVAGKIFWQVYFICHSWNICIFSHITAKNETHIHCTESILYNYWNIKVQLMQCLVRDFWFVKHKINIMEFIEMKLWIKHVLYKLISVNISYISYTFIILAGF